jgi:hypothetical protein
MPDIVATEAPRPTPTVEEAPKPPELRTKFNEAARLGIQLTGIDKDRIEAGFSCFRDSPVLTDFYRSFVDVPDAELTDERVLEAQKATFGFTLEGARQIAQRETIQPRGINDDTESLAELQRTIIESADFAEQFRVTNPEGYSEAARKVFAAELGKKPEELALDGDNLTNLVDETYSAAGGRLTDQLEALRAYTGRY